MESPSGEIRLDSWAFLISTELFEHSNQVVAGPFLQRPTCAPLAPHLRPTCALALVWMLIGDNWSHLEAKTSIYGQRRPHSNPADVCKSPRIQPYFTRRIFHRLYPAGHETSSMSHRYKLVGGGSNAGYLLPFQDTLQTWEKDWQWYKVLWLQ